MDALESQLHAPDSVNAQCPACRLHALVPMVLRPLEDGRWELLEGSDSELAVGAPGVEVVQIDACPVCNGAWFDAGELDLLAGESANIEGLLAPESELSERRCPRGCGDLDERALPAKIRTPVDHCATCHGIWLDGHERHKLARSTTHEGRQERSKRLARRGVIWAAQLLTQLPVEVENPASGTPWVIYALLVVCATCFGLEFVGIIDLHDCTPGLGGMPVGDTCMAPVAGALRYQWGELGAQALFSGSWYTLATHWLLHASVPHLLVNAYFLYIFGDNIEHLFGHGRFMLMFLVAAVGGGLAEVLLTQNTLAPIVGASGGIAGVMAAYLWCFPRNKLFQVVLFVQFKLPAWVYLFAWVGFQGLMGLLETRDAGVAWFSHLFGFAIGAAMTPVFLAHRRREVARAVHVPATGYGVARPPG